jgi:beta-galactosidase
MRVSVRLFCGLMLAVIAFAAEPRTLLRLDSGWRFHRGDIEGASAPAFDDAAWQVVSIPHTWNTEGDPPRPGYYRGPGWYRQQFVAPAQWKGRRVFVRFEAASLVARVFLNGKELGEHRGGFAAFCYELTPYLQAGGNNLLAVRVDNTLRQDVVPLSGDFTVYGGLYRPVSLITTAAVDISLLDYASPGVYLQPKEVTPARAEIRAITKVSNGPGAARKIEVAVTVLDARGRKVVSQRRSAKVAGGETQPVAVDLRIDKPHLWNGVADPYLYTTRVELLEDGKIADLVEQPLGLRFFHFDPARGFVLNGKAQQIHGVCRHQDFGGLGWAIGEKEQDTDMRIIREMGVNGVRLAHYQHNDYFYRLCDSYGLVVWAELALVDYVRATPPARENVRQQLTELIRQNFNHPSIVLWSLYNEINSKNQDDPIPIVTDLRDLAKAEDTSRPTVAANSKDDVDNLPALGRVPDLPAINTYPGWYFGKAADMGQVIDSLNTLLGSKGIIVSEYGAGASIHHHQQDFTNWKEGRVPSEWHPEEYQALLHEQAYAAIKARPIVSGSFVWNIFDFAAANRKEGDAPGINDKGLVTRDRKVRKDAYFFYQANWTTDPMIYITSRRDTDRTAPETPVKVYSNCEKVTLRVNGKDYGAAQDNGMHVFVWSGVSLMAGENRIEVEGTTRGRVVRDSCQWTYRPKRTN